MRAASVLRPAPPSWPPIGSMRARGRSISSSPNPPYLASREIAALADEVAAFDPILALDGGPDGLDAYRRIAARAGEILAEDGRLVVEIGAAQGEAVVGGFSGVG